MIEFTWLEREVLRSLIPRIEQERDNAEPDDELGIRMDDLAWLIKGTVEGWWWE